MASKFHVGAVLDAEDRLAIRLAVALPRQQEWSLTPEEARRLAEELLCEAAYADNWQAVIARQQQREAAR